jgi:hypothetical protein
VLQEASVRSVGTLWQFNVHAPAPVLAYGAIWHNKSQAGCLHISVGTPQAAPQCAELCVDHAVC